MAQNRKAWVLLAFLLIPIGTYAQSPKEVYFPDLAFSQKRNSHDFRVDWYTKHLIVLEEPSLLELAKEKTFYSYRILWLRTFDEPISLRLVIDPEGTGLIIVKMADGAGGYEPGKLIANETVLVKKENVDKFLKMIDNSAFWQLPTIEKSTVLGMDGARWIMEGVNATKYHVVDRWSPTRGIFRETALFLVKLAGLKINKKTVY